MKTWVYFYNESMHFGVCPKCKEPAYTTQHGWDGEKIIPPFVPFYGEPTEVNCKCGNFEVIRNFHLEYKLYKKAYEDYHHTVVTDKYRGVFWSPAVSFKNNTEVVKRGLEPNHRETFGFLLF